MTIALKAVDRLSLSFIGLLGVIALLFIPAFDSRIRLVTLYFMLAAAVVVLAFYRARLQPGKNGFYFHVAFTVGMVLVLFNSLGDLIAEVCPRTFDDMLIRIDYALFGVHPTIWMERFINPAVTAVLQISYISYYFMPVALGVTLISKNRQHDFEDAMFGIVLCFYLSYVGYLLMPAIGPRFTLDALQTAGLDAGPFITAIRETLDKLEHNKTDAFPSGHTAIAIVTLYYAGKAREKMLFRILLPLVLALIVSTVYLRYHYVIDIIAGVALAAVTVLTAPTLGLWLSGKTRHPGNQRHHSA